MKKIVVGIDFSDCSINALEHAITIANKADADLLLLWVNKPSGNRDVFSSEIGDIFSKVNFEFDRLIDRFQGEMQRGEITYTIREGKVYTEIAELAKEVEAFMVIIGTHGASGFQEFWMGSNANRVVALVDCPIITIRGGVDIERSLVRIVMPLDSTLETRQKVPVTVELAKYFEAEIYILCLYTTKVQDIRKMIDSYADQVSKYMDEEGVKYNVAALESENITDSTIEYAEKVDANLIAIMTDQEKTVANIILGPYAQQMVNHSPIPVLTVHARELMVSGYR